MRPATRDGVRAARCTRLVALAVLLFAASACGDGGEEASPTRPTGVESMLADCTPFNDSLRCAARVTSAAGSARDVTNEAAWSVSPPGVATAPQPGVLVPIAAADVTVTVQYQTLRNGNPIEYRLAPGATPRPLTFLGVSALDESRAPLFRATVEIVAGTGAGQACVTNETGYCSMRGVLYSEPLRVRVSADGYVPAERDHRIDPFPGTPFLTVLLAKAAR